jgi:hypothetical protein
MLPLTVQRIVPSEFVRQVRAGHYTLHGGVVRDQASRIVGHLLLPAGGSANALEPALGPLSTGTSALMGMNLVVSAAGFAMVCRKLEGIRSHLCGMDGKIDRLLAGQARLLWETEARRRAELGAALENLALGVRLGERHLTLSSIAAIELTVQHHQLIGEHLLTDLAGAYREPQPVIACVRMAPAATLLRAHGLAHLGHPMEAVDTLNRLLEWLAGVDETIRRPVDTSPAPIWLGRLEQQGTTGWRSLVELPPAIVAAIEYARDQCQLCADYKVAPGDVANLAVSGEAMLLLPAPRTGGGGAGQEAPGRGDRAPEPPVGGCRRDRSPPIRAIRRPSYSRCCGRRP